MHASLWLTVASFIPSCWSVDIDVSGVISFELRGGRDVGGVGEGGEGLRLRLGRGSERSGGRVVGGAGVTAAALVECAYQHPEQQQVDALLSNMMNRLTKIFFRAKEYMRLGHESTQQEHLGYETVQTNERTPELKAFRHDERRQARFRVVNQSKPSFFDEIYTNMTEEFRGYYNSTVNRVNRAGPNSNSCTPERQEEIRSVWRELIERSRAALERASLSCLEHVLQHHGMNHPAATPSDQTGRKDRTDVTSVAKVLTKTRAKLERLVQRELARLKINQLNTLCERFQLCYNELLDS